MKTKKFIKKLRLEKRTISNLTGNAMGDIKGGVITDDTCTCPQSCIDPCLPNTTPIECPPTNWRCTYYPQEECITQP